MVLQDVLNRKHTCQKHAANWEAYTRHGRSPLAWSGHASIDGWNHPELSQNARQILPAGFLTQPVAMGPSCWKHSTNCGVVSTARTFRAQTASVTPARAGAWPLSATTSSG